jgi:hypothetical protein
MIYPDVGYPVPPNPDLPKDIRRDYLEAASILGRSPRGAAALLRLAVQKLCKLFGQPGKDLNSDIGKLVADGLPREVQMSLDAVRVIGNNAVHPGELDIRDDAATATTLFKLVNFIATKMISEKQEIAAFYEKLPEPKREAIEKRDRRSP